MVGDTQICKEKKKREEIFFVIFSILFLHLSL